ncbi:MAG TPA: putative sugar O-methyltransferase [Vicinamibacterales bacterium]
MESGIISASAALQERLARLRASDAFKNYEYARERVLEMRAQIAASPEHKPSAYWEEELSTFEYMLDASPLVIEKLRHHTHWITGIRAYEYRSQRKRAKVRLTEKVQALLALGLPDLFVSEWRGLGGYGFEHDGKFFNIDTTKFYEVLIALERGAVLPEFRHNSDRRLVWEIGAGWGGFPYQFKTVCPNVTYVISDFPELFLYSATYLMTAFPGAKVAFWGEDSTERLLERWREYDFIFLSNTALEEMKPERLDLTVNMVSFQEMTEAQADAYVAKAHALNCPFVYSLNRDKSAYNPEITSVSDVISRYYWPREIAVLPVPYTKMMDELPSANDYKHIIGWRRIQSPVPSPRSSVGEGASGKRGSTGR